MDTDKTSLCPYNLDAEQKPTLPLCPSTVRLLDLYTSMGYPATFLYDEELQTPLYVSIQSRTIRKALGKGGFSTVLDNTHIYSVRKVIAHTWRMLRDKPMEERMHYLLSMNVCLDPKRLLYLTLQIAPLQDSQSLEVCYLCTLHFSTRTGSHIYLLNRQSNSYHFFSTRRMQFIAQTHISLRPLEEEMLRLAHLGREIPDIAGQLNISVDQVKYLRRTLFSKLRVKTIQEAVSYSRRHHLL